MSRRVTPHPMTPADPRRGRDTTPRGRPRTEEEMRTTMDEFPRRNRMDLWTPAERAIYDAVQAVECAGAHPLLTDAVILLGQARDKVADFVDQQPPEPR